MFTPVTPMKDGKFALETFNLQGVRAIMTEPPLKVSLELCFQQFINDRVAQMCLNANPEQHALYRAHVVAVEALWEALENTVGTRKEPPPAPFRPTI